MKRVLPVLLVLAVLGAGISFVAAPLVAFGALRSAAEAEDVQGLSKLVDFDAVRASLAPQLDAKPGVEAPPPSVLQDPLGALRRAIEPMAEAATKPAGPKPDDYLKPAALQRLTEGAGRDAWRPAPATDGAEPEAKFPEVSHWGVDRTRLTVADPADPAKETVFTFERRGPFQWKLVHVGLPSETPAKAGPAPR